jgi:hypothetical protein
VSNATFDGFLWTQSQNPDFANQWTYGYGGYIRDVRQNTGYWPGDKAFGHLRDSNNEIYVLDVDNNREYSGWGAMATGLAYLQSTVLEKELVVDGVIGHAIGVITPGSNDEWVYPASRRDVGSGGPLPQGGFWTLDPAFNIAGLTSLGDANADAFRAMMLQAIKDYGLITIDSSASDMGLRQESMGGTYGSTLGFYGSYTVGGDIFGAQSMNAMMDSVAASNWRFVSPSYRPSGATLNPATDTFTEDFTGPLDIVTKWGAAGVTIVGARANFAVSTGGAVLYPLEGGVRSLVGSTSMVELVTPAGDAFCQFYLVPETTRNTSGVAFNVVGGNLRAEHYDIFGTKVGTDTVVAYNAVNHRWLRFRESSWSVVWETSPGGAGAPGTWTWTTIRTDTPTWDLNAVGQTIYVQGTTGGTAVFDNLNLSTSAPPDVTPPAAPTGLVAVGQVGSIALNWSDNTEPDLNASAPYIVERATAVGGPFTQTATTVSSDYVDFSITPGVTYYYRVRAQDNAP